MPPTEVRDTLRGRPVGSCIYCGDTTNLTDEHVIPFALGGRFVLPQASCRRCAAVTSAFELKVARGFLQAARATAGFPTRRRNERPRSLPLEVIRDEAFVAEDVPITDYPAIVPLPLLAPAGFLYGRPVSPGVEIFGQETISFGKLPPNALAALGTTAVRVTIDWDMTAYARLLAKVALGFTVAAVGPLPRSEVPILPLILGTADDASTWMGSAPFKLSVEQQGPTHAVGTQIRSNPNDVTKKIVVAQVKLFANSGATGVEVVTWTPDRFPERLLTATG